MRQVPSQPLAIEHLLVDALDESVEDRGDDGPFMGAIVVAILEGEGDGLTLDVGDSDSGADDVALVGGGG